MTAPVTPSDICSLWIEPEDAAACCTDLADTDDMERLTWAIQQASELLFHLSGGLYAGVCTALVRPCASPTSCWTPRLDHWAAGSCSCRRLSKIRLAGYPVREITAVKIDGDVLPSSEYRLQYGRELIRLNGERWPGCQRMDIDEGEGTFFVEYEYGLEPPSSGVTAAGELACQIAQACTTSDGETGDCELPAGTVRVTRQGLTIDAQSLGLWLIGTLRTGMPLVDAFLSVYGSGRKRRTALMVPEQDPWPVRVA